MCLYCSMQLTVLSSHMLVKTCQEIFQCPMVMSNKSKVLPEHVRWPILENKPTYHGGARVKSLYEGPAWDRYQTTSQSLQQHANCFTRKKTSFSSFSNLTQNYFLNSCLCVLIAPADENLACANSVSLSDEQHNQIKPKNIACPIFPPQNVPSHLPLQQKC